MKNRNKQLYNLKSLTAISAIAVFVSSCLLSTVSANSNYQIDHGQSSAYFEYNDVSSWTRPSLQRSLQESNTGSTESNNQDSAKKDESIVKANADPATTSSSDQASAAATPSKPLKSDLSVDKSDNVKPTDTSIKGNKDN